MFFILITDVTTILVTLSQSTNQFTGQCINLFMTVPAGTAALGQFGCPGMDTGDPYMTDIGMVILIIDQDGMAEVAETAGVAEDDKNFFKASRMARLCFLLNCLYYSKYGNNHYKKF